LCGIRQHRQLAWRRFGLLDRALSKREDDPETNDLNQRPLDETSP
jgi:hypothetical protein